MPRRSKKRSTRSTSRRGHRRSALLGVVVRVPRKFGLELGPIEQLGDKAQEYATKATAQMRSGDCRKAAENLRIASFLHGKAAGLYSKAQPNNEVERHLDYVSKSIDFSAGKFGTLCLLRKHDDSLTKIR